MAANLKKPAEKKDEKAAVKEGKGFSLDLKWVLAGLGLVAITMGSVIIGIQLAPGKVVIHEVDKKEFVERIIKPGIQAPLLTDHVVNLDAGHYLRFSCVLQFVENKKIWPEGGGGGEGKKGPDPLEPYMAMMKDTVLTVCSAHTAAQLETYSGKEKLKDEIKKRLNDELKEGGDPDHPTPEVYRVYFTDFVIQ